MRSRMLWSIIENKHVRRLPSAVSRSLAHSPQNGIVTGAMIPISPGAPSANAYRTACFTWSIAPNRDQLVSLFDSSNDFAAADQHVAVPLMRVIQRHVLDEPHRDSGLSREIGEVGNFIVVQSTNDDAVDLRSGKAGSDYRFDSIEHRSKRVSSRDHLEHFRLERITTDRYPSQAGRLEEAARSLSPSPLVVRARSRTPGMAASCSADTRHHVEQEAHRL